MEYFVISAKFVPAEILYTLIATTSASLVFQLGVRVGEFCHPARSI